MLQYEIVHSQYYFERELYLLKISGEMLDKDRFAMVYKRSGMNGGKKGHMLPFHYLQDTLPRFSDARNGVVPGYIWKKFYFNRDVVYHGKRPEMFGEGVSEFLDRLTEDFSSMHLEPESQSMDNVLEIAENFNHVVHKHMDQTNRFDWGVLNIAKGIKEAAT